MEALKHALKNINSDFGGFLDEVLKGEVFEVEAWSENAECYALERLEKRGLNLAFTRVKTTSHRRDWLLSEAKKINQIAAHNIIFFTSAERLSICLAPRRQNRATSHAADVVEKYIFIKDIELERPNYGHLLNLQSLQTAQMGDSLEGYYANLVENLSIQGLNDRFYGELVAIFREFVRGITLPADSRCLANNRPAANPSRVPNAPAADNRAESSAQIFVLRLFSRLLFCKFLEKKGVLPREIWDVDVSPLYYHEVLEPLFFATLNTPKEARKPQLSQKIQALLDAIPYLNGGLFAPHFEDFYDPAHPRANAAALIVPNALFTQLFGLFERYHFSIDENSDENVLEIALDPELLGCVFERLLGELYPENESKKGDSKGEDAAEMDAESSAESESKTAAASESKAAKNSKRKETGSYYTPREIVRYIVRGALEAHLGAKFDAEKLKALIHEGENCFGSESAAVRTALDSLKILDPACGSGAFPMQCLHEILRLQGLLKDLRPASVRKLEILQNAIFGVDIQPMATEIARLRCFLSIIIDEEIIKPLPNLEFKFVSTNALIPLPKPSLEYAEFHGDEARLQKLRAMFFVAESAEIKEAVKKEFLALQKHIAQQLVFNTGGEIAQTQWNPFEDSHSAPFFDPAWMFGVENFDIVLGNPPYISSENTPQAIKDNRHRFKTACKKTDIYVYFYEVGLNLLKNNGVISYITSDKFLSVPYGLNLRKLLLENNINHIIKFDVNVFKSASVHTCIMSLTKRSPRDNVVLVKEVAAKSDWRGFENIDFREMSQSMFGLTESYSFRLTLTEQKIALLKKVLEKSHRLSDICFVSYGCRPCGNAKYPTLKKEDFVSANPKGNAKPYIESKSAYTKRYIIHSHAYLDYQPEKFYNAMFEELFLCEKLMGNKVVTDVATVNFVYDDSGLFCNDSMCCIVLWKDLESCGYGNVKKQINRTKIELSRDYNLKFLQGVLNSKLARFYVKELLHDGLNFTPDQQKQLPIPKIDESNAALVAQITALVEQVLAKGGDAAIEREIDSLVFALYGLNADEIAVVAGA